MMSNKSHWKTLTAFLMVMVLIMTACELPGSVAQSAPAEDDSGQEEPVPEQPVEAPPEEQAPVEEPVAQAPVEEPDAPAPTQAPAGSTGDATTGSQTGIIIVLLLILVMIGVILLIVAGRGRGGQSQPQTPAAEAPASPPTQIDDNESNDPQSS